MKSYTIKKLIKKIISFVIIGLLFAGCDWAMDNLDVRNGTKYIVTSKRKKVGDFHYTYHLIKDRGMFYDYLYIDTTEFNVGDTLVLTIKRQSK